MSWLGSSGDVAVVIVAAVWKKRERPFDCSASQSLAAP